MKNLIKIAQALGLDLCKTSKGYALHKKGHHHNDFTFDDLSTVAGYLAQCVESVVISDQTQKDRSDKKRLRDLFQKYETPLALRES
jgi:hypothetical protein